MPAASTQQIFDSADNLCMDGRAYRNYGCVTHHTRGSSICANNKTCSEHKVTEAVLKAIRDQVMVPDLLSRFVETFKKEAQKLLSGRDNDTADIQKQLQAAERTIANLTDSLGRMGWSDAIGDQLKKEEARAKTLRTQLSAKKQAMGVVLPHPAMIERYLSDLMKLVTVDPEQGREVLARHLAPILMVVQGKGPNRHYVVKGAFNLSLALQKDKTPAPSTGTGVFAKTGSGGATDDAELSDNI